MNAPAEPARLGADRAMTSAANPRARDNALVQEAGSPRRRFGCCRNNLDPRSRRIRSAGRLRRHRPAARDGVLRRHTPALRSSTMTSRCWCSRASRSAFRTHPDAPRVLLANSNWCRSGPPGHFNELDRKADMYGDDGRIMDLHWQPGIVQAPTRRSRGRAQHFGATGATLDPHRRSRAWAAPAAGGHTAGAVSLNIECSSPASSFAAHALPRQAGARTSTMRSRWFSSTARAGSGLDRLHGNAAECCRSGATRAGRA